MEETGVFDHGGTRLAWRRRPGRAPCVVFLPGFRSAMSGEKGAHLDALCAVRGQAFLRFDYGGHGESGGDFEAGTIGLWRDQARALIAHLAPGPVLLVGSSMGGWIGLLLARELPVAGFVGIAAAPDFTETLMWEAMGPPERATLLRAGRLVVPSLHAPPYAITRALIEDGRRQLVLGGGKIPLAGPVRLLHGQRDEDVPWETALRLADAVAGEDVRVTLVKDAGHRLSRPADLALLGAVIGGLLGEDGA